VVDFSQRPLPTDLSTALGATITEPGWLVRFDVGAESYFFSSRDEVTIGPDIFSPYDVNVSSLTWGDDFAKSLNILFGGVNDALAALLLSANFINSKTTVLVYYDDAAAYEVFIGVVESVSIDPSHSTVKCVTENAKVLLRPGYRMRRDTGFPYLPVEGTIVTFRNLQWTLDVPTE
jgi:hypothetical protein